MPPDLLTALMQGTPTGLAVLALYILLDRRLVAVETTLKLLKKE